MRLKGVSLNSTVSFPVVWFLLVCGCSSCCFSISFMFMTSLFIFLTNLWYISSFYLVMFSHRWCLSSSSFSLTIYFYFYWSSLAYYFSDMGEVPFRSNLFVCSQLCFRLLSLKGERDSSNLLISWSTVLWLKVCFPLEEMGEKVSSLLFSSFSALINKLPMSYLGPPLCPMFQLSIFCLSKLTYSELFLSLLAFWLITSWS